MDEDTDSQVTGLTIGDPDLVSAGSLSVTLEVDHGSMQLQALPGVHFVTPAAADGREGKRATLVPPPKGPGVEAEAAHLPNMALS